MSNDGSSVKTYNLTQQFYEAYKKCEVFKYDPKTHNELPEKYEEGKEIYNVRMSPTIVSLVTRKE